MKDNYRVLQIFIIVATFVPFGWSQNNVRSKSDVDSMVMRARDVLSRSAHRETMVHVNNDARLKVTQTYGFTNEFIPPNRWYCIAEFKSGSVIRGGQTVIIGDDRFSKVGKERWKKDSNAGCESGLDTLANLPSNPYEEFSESVVVGRKENQLTGNLVTELYEITTRQKFPKSQNENIYESRFWFDKDGRLVKAERKSTSTKSKSWGRRTSIYEYDPNIKIEAPIK